MHRFASLFLACALFAAAPLAQAASTRVTVSGGANPWLAGMPDGSTAGLGDLAPGHSPAQVTGLSVTGGRIFFFTSTGQVAKGTGAPFFGPEGNTDHIVSRNPGAENGIADLTAPLIGLVGVFLDDNQPSSFSPPSALDFTSSAQRDFASLSPQLRQPFYIGDGITSAGPTQFFIAPAGATRLFLGPMDAFQWSGNPGSFTVTVTALPEPSAACLLSLLLLGRKRFF